MIRNGGCVKYRAFVIDRVDDNISATLSEKSLNKLEPGEVRVQLRYSSINFKDALAASGTSPILRTYPLTGGIDASGTVVESRSPSFKTGDEVLSTGYELGVSSDGGYAEYLTVNADKILRIPAGLNARESMLLGTAGFSAALALYRMQQNGQTPDDGPLLITGATGGVGSIATAIANKLGYDVVAMSRRKEHYDFLKQLGASTCITGDTLFADSKPLARAEWAGAIDSLGGKPLSTILSCIKPFGNVASIGLAAGRQLETTVLPFILRGISLLGIDSVNCPYAVREQIWARLGSEWKPDKLDVLHRDTVGLDGMQPVFTAMMQGESLGRTLVDIQLASGPESAGS